MTRIKKEIFKGVTIMTNKENNERPNDVYYWVLNYDLNKKGMSNSWLLNYRDSKYTALYVYGTYARLLKFLEKFKEDFGNILITVSDIENCTYRPYDYQVKLVFNEYKLKKE